MHYNPMPRYLPSTRTLPAYTTNLIPIPPLLRHRLWVRDRSQLRLYKLIIPPAQLDELIVRSLLHHLPLLHDEDDVGFADGRKAVGDRYC
jgi:hypothetical protein